MKQTVKIDIVDQVSYEAGYATGYADGAREGFGIGYGECQKDINYYTEQEYALEVLMNKQRTLGTILLMMATGFVILPIPYEDVKAAFAIISFVMGAILTFSKELLLAERKYC